MSLLHMQVQLTGQLMIFTITLTSTATVFTNTYIYRRVWLTKAVVGVHVMSFRLFTFPHVEAKHSYGSLYSLWDQENPQHSGIILYNYRTSRSIHYPAEIVFHQGLKEVHE